MFIRLLTFIGFAYFRYSQVMRKTWDSTLNPSKFICMFWNWSPSLVQLFCPLSLVRRIAENDFHKQCRF